MQQKRGLVEIFLEELRVRNYTHDTIRSYKSQLRSFIRYFLPRHPRSLRNEDLRRYLVFLLVEKGLSAKTVNQAYNALKFLYVQLYKREFFELPRPQKEQKLPDVLNDQEVLRIFRTVKNIKHRTMLMMAYATGLRVGELVRGSN